MNAGHVSRQAAPIQFGTENTRIRSICAVSTPAQIQAELLLTEAAARTTLEVEGRQDIRLPDQMTYGQSVTDACIGWDDTLKVLGELSGNVAQRRNGLAHTV